jgi:hypothetical protein
MAGDEPMINRILADVPAMKNPNVGIPGSPPAAKFTQAAYARLNDNVGFSAARWAYGVTASSGRSDAVSASALLASRRTGSGNWRRGSGP